MQNGVTVIITGSCDATPAANTLVVTGTASVDDVRKAVEQAGFEFKGVK